MNSNSKTTPEQLQFVKQFIKENPIPIPNPNKQRPKKPRKPKNRINKSIVNENYGQQLASTMTKGYGATLRMYPSTLAFAKVYTDPFVMDSARIPVFPIVSSSLERYYATGKGSTNASGFGWVTVSPLYFSAKDGNAVRYSDASSGDNIGDTPQVAESSSPHSLSDYWDTTGTYSVRIVSIGIRVRYIGTNLNAAGTNVRAQMSPLGDSISGQNYASLKQLPGYKESDFRTGAWHATTRHVEGQQDTFFAEYSKDESRWIFPDSTAHPWDENFRNAIYIAAEPNQKFEWEVAAHYELLGTNLVRRGVTTPDTTGFEHVTGTMAERRQRDSTTKDHNVGGSWSTLTGFLKESAKTLVPMIPGLITKLLL